MAKKKWVSNLPEMRIESASNLRWGGTKWLWIEKLPANFGVFCRFAT